MADFLRLQSQVFNQTALLIKTSPAQDKQMLKYLQQFGRCKTVPLFPDNCARGLFRIVAAMMAPCSVKA